MADLTSIIKTVLESTLDEVLVKGEISNFKQHSSGHRYFTLKDDQAQLNCVMWRTRTLPFIPVDGMSVVAGGRVTVYPARGNYQLDCVFLRADGVGALYKAFEKLKADLEARGWFDATRKRSLPKFPQRVGIATSATGAALQDMITTIERRYSPLEVVFRPTLVQGDTSAEDIAQAIADLNAADVEVIIVGRGGGSMEDLWSFNTEVVARAIVHSAVPVISAVGHETDFTIADFVADCRAATPTAAAEIVTPRLSRDIVQWVDETQSDIHSIMLERVQEFHELVIAFTQGSVLLRIEERLVQMQQSVAALAQRQHLALSNKLDTLASFLREHHGKQQTVITGKLQLIQQHIGHTMQQIKALHPHRPLQLGYALIERNHRPLPVQESLKEGEHVNIIRWNEVTSATVTQVTTKSTGVNDGNESNRT